MKSTGENIDDIVRSEQVMRYVNRYKQVLVTNYRDFVLVGVNHEGKVTNREISSLAQSLLLAVTQNNLKGFQVPKYPCRSGALLD